MNNREALAILGLTQAGLSSESLVAAYRKAAGRHHPDRGGNPDAFRACTEARDLLRARLERRARQAPTETSPSETFAKFRDAAEGLGGALEDLLNQMTDDLDGANQRIFRSLLRRYRSEAKVALTASGLISISNSQGETIDLQLTPEVLTQIDNHLTNHLTEEKR